MFCATPRLHSGLLGCREHLFDLVGVHRHRFFAKYVLVMPGGHQNMFEMERVGRDYKYRVDLGRRAERLRGGKDVRDGIFARVRFSFLSVTPPQSDELCVRCSGKAGHQPPYSMMAEAENSKPGHMFY